MELFLSLVQDTCNLVSENVLPVALMAVLVSSVVWLLVAMIYQGKLAKVSKTAAEAIQSRRQISEQLAQTEQVVQQLQTDTSQQTARIGQLEQEKQAEIERVQTLTQQLTDSAGQCETLNQSMVQLQNALQQQQLETQQENTRAETLTAQLQQQKNSLNQSLQVLATFLEQAAPSDTLDSSALWQQHEILLAETLARLTLHSSQYNELQETLHEANHQLNEQMSLIENLEQELDHKNLELEQQTLLLQAQAVLDTPPPVAIEPEPPTLQHAAVTLEPIIETSVFEVLTEASPQEPEIDNHNTPLAAQTAPVSKEKTEKAKPWSAFQRLYTKPTVAKKSEQQEPVALEAAVVELPSPIPKSPQNIEVSVVETLAETSHIAPPAPNSKEKAKPWAAFQGLYQKATPVEKSKQKAELVPPPVIEIEVEKAVKIAEEQPSAASNEKPQIDLNSVTAIAEQDFHKISQAFKGLYRKVLGKK